MSASDLLMWKRAITFIAFNDEPMDWEYENILNYLSTVAISETFSVPTAKVAKAVLKIRKQALKKGKL